MGTIKATAIFTYPSGLPSDVAMNSFYFRTAGSSITEAEYRTVTNVMKEFYTEPTDGGSITEFLSDYIVDGADKLKVRFAQFDPATGLEIDIESVETFDLSISSGVSLPLECAACLSFNAAPLSISQKARARGRIFLGPLSTAALVQADPEPPRVSSGLLEVLAAAGERLLNDSVAGWGELGDPAPWVIWSRTDGDTKEVIGGWVDNELDTMRKRQVEPSFRQTFGFIV